MALVVLQRPSDGSGAEGRNGTKTAGFKYKRGH